MFTLLSFFTRIVASAKTFIVVAQLTLLSLCAFNAQSKCLIMVTAGGGHTFWHATTLGAQKAAIDNGYQIISRGTYESTTASAQLSIINFFQNYECDGLILAPNEKSVVDALVLNYDKPIILIDRKPENSRLPVVKTNDYFAGELAAKQLIQLSQKTIDLAIVLNNQTEAHLNQRALGFTNLLKQTFSQVKLKHLHSGRSVGSAREIIFQQKELIRSAQVVYATNELGSLALNQDLAEIENIKIGFDCHPALIKATTANKMLGFISQNAFQIGYASAVKLINNIESEAPLTSLYLNPMFIDYAFIQKLPEPNCKSIYQYLAHTSTN